MSPLGKFRYVSTDRRVREDRRFVAGKGNFVADINLPNTKHVALVTCPHAAARIIGIDKSAALKMPGVHYILDGDELAAATLPLMTGLDTPNVPRRPLAHQIARYSGEWVVAIVADSRAQAEDAAEEVVVDYEPLPFVLDAEQALASDILGIRHGSTLLDKTSPGARSTKEGFPAQAEAAGEMGPLVDGADRTFGVTASGPLGHPRRPRLDPDAALQRPNWCCP